MPSHWISAWNCLAPVLEAPVVPQTKTQGDRLAEAVHVGPHPLAHRLQRRPAVALLRHVPADDLRCSALDGLEDPSAFVQNRDASVPQSSSGLSVRIRPPLLRSPQRCPRRTGTSSPCSRIGLSTRSLPTRIPSGRTPRLHLAVTLTEERTRLQHRPDLSSSSSSLSAAFGPRLQGFLAIRLRWPGEPLLSTEIEGTIVQGNPARLLPVTHERRRVFRRVRLNGHHQRLVPL